LIHTCIWILDHFSIFFTIAESEILAEFLTFLIQSIFTKLGEMTDADKTMNRQHFNSNPAYIRIRIRINPEIRVRIPDHFRSTFRPWQSLRSLNALIIIIIIIIIILLLLVSLQNHQNKICKLIDVGITSELRSNARRLIRHWVCSEVGGRLDRVATR